MRVSVRLLLLGSWVWGFWLEGQKERKKEAEMKRVL